MSDKGFKLLLFLSLSPPLTLSVPFSLSLILIVSSRKRATRKGISVCFFAPAAYKANCSQWQRQLKLPCCMQQLCTVISSCLSVCMCVSLSPPLPLLLTVVISESRIEHAKYGHTKVSRQTVTSSHTHCRRNWCN